MVKAFGIPVFTVEGKSKNPVVVLKEINDRLVQLNVSDENVINIQVEQEFYHVFYTGTT